jgi:tryptophan 7-halogenase
MKAKQIAIIGMGTAGVQTLCHYLTWSHNTVITSIHSPQVPIVGIGESTNSTFIDVIEQGMDFKLYDSLTDGDMDCTIKLGTQYINWRNHSFTNPLLGGNAAIHFNTFAMQDFALPKLRKRWKDKFREIHGVADIKENTNNVLIEVGGKEYQFDYVIDCRGWPKDLTDYTKTDQPVNHCLVHNMPEGADWKVTKHIATKDGWTFAIPLTSRTSYGYLFNNTITNPDEARENFKQMLGVEELDNIEYKFQSYYTDKLIDNRVIKNGNRAVFFEPLFANSLWIYHQANIIGWDYIFGKSPQIQPTIDRLNEQFRTIAKGLEELIAFHYHGGSIYDSPFWQKAMAESKEKLKDSQDMKSMLDRFKRMRNDNSFEDSRWVYPTRSLELVDKNFGYNYFQPN